MRLSITLLTLTFATAVLSDLIDTISNVISNVDFSAFPECKAAVDEYNECQFDTFNLDSVASNIDVFCGSFSTEKCQNFFNKGLVGIPACQNISEELLMPTKILHGMMYSFLNLACSKDENNNYCPIAGHNILNLRDKSESEILASINESCKSKKCYETANDTFTRVENAELLTKLLFKQQMNDLNLDTNQSQTLDKITEYLKSENCTAQHTIPMGNAESSAETTSIGTVLIIALGLLLSIIF